MRRIATLLAFVLLFVPAVVPAAAAERNSYIVSTRASAHLLPLSFDDREHRVVRFKHFEAYTAMLTDEEAESLRHSPDVRHVQRDFKVHVLEDADSVMQLNTELRLRQESSHEYDAQQIPWGVVMVNAPAVWNYARGAGIKVGVIDSGIDETHPDLMDRYKGGYDFVNNDSDPEDEYGHGTHVAGIIAASDNAFGVVGVAPEVDLYALKVIDSKGSGDFSKVLMALDWAVEHKLNIVNLSLGAKPAEIDLNGEYFASAASQGVIAVAAAGNDYDTNPVDGLDVPAAYPSVISVGAIDSTRMIAPFSQRGPGLQLVAPGVDVPSTYPFVATLESPVGTFDAVPMVGSKRNSFSGSLVDCGLGKPGDFANVTGKIALIQRGEIAFADKVRNAVTAGAIGAVVYNNVPGPFAGTLFNPDDPTTNTYPWPGAVTISQEDGEALRQAGNGTMVSIRIESGYSDLTGTSMSTPHVTGVLALIWSAAPNATAQEVINALLSTARDDGAPGYDTVYGNGVPDAWAAAKQLAPQLFPAHRRRSIRP